MMTQRLSRLSSVSMLLSVILLCLHQTVYSENITDENVDFWSSLLEQYTVESSEPRQGKYLQKQFSSNGRVYITRRIGEAYESNFSSERPPIPFQEMRPPHTMSKPRPFPAITKRIDNQPTKPTNFRPVAGRLQPTEISETDLYLLGAIEKLVYRVDYLEKRLKKTDELVLYLMEKQHQQELAAHQLNHPKPINGQLEKPISQPIRLNATQQLLTEKELPCFDNSTKIGENCYMVVYSQSTDWQSANSLCKSKSSSSQLLEFNSYKEYYDVGIFLNSNKKYKKHNYWLGGLNPGLLWIWSSTAKPVNPFTNELLAEKNDLNAFDTKNANATDIQGAGRCLSYSFNSTSKHYMYFGQNCNLKMGYLCKIMDLTVENEISRIAKELNLGKL